MRVELDEAGITRPEASRGWRHSPIDSRDTIDRGNPRWGAKVASARWRGPVGASSVSSPVRFRARARAGVKPARRISAVATALLYSFAVAVPFLHNYVMANVGL